MTCSHIQYKEDELVGISVTYESTYFVLSCKTTHMCFNLIVQLHAVSFLFFCFSDLTQSQILQSATVFWDYFTLFLVYGHFIMKQHIKNSNFFNNNQDKSYFYKTMKWLWQVLVFIYIAAVCLDQCYERLKIHVFRSSTCSTMKTCCQVSSQLVSASKAGESTCLG